MQCRQRSPDETLEEVPQSKLLPDVVAIPANMHSLTGLSAVNVGRCTAAVSGPPRAESILSGAVSAG